MKMKSMRISAGLLLGVAVLVSSSAWAAQRASLKFYDDVNVGQSQVKAGDYTVQWEGNGPEVELSIIKGNTVVAKVPARLVDARPATSNTIETASNPNGTRSLEQIKLRGKKYAIEVGTEAAQAQPAAQNK
jgi:hypothetical protein